MLSALCSRNVWLRWICCNKSCVSTDYILLLYTIQRHRWRQILRLYYTIPLPDKDQSNRPKHVVEIRRLEL